VEDALYLKATLLRCRFASYSAFEAAAMKLVRSSPSMPTTSGRKLRT
jgi:hypothetical protein